MLTDTTTMPRRDFRAMSTKGSIVLSGTRIADADRLLSQAVSTIDDLERRWTRFDEHSELSAINAHAGRPVRVSSATVRLVTAMVQGWHATGGDFDPTLLATLVSLGYVASRCDHTHRTSVAAGTLLCGRPDQILVDPAHRIVRLPASTAIDAGGIGKGLAADLVVEALLAGGAPGALVEIGGDLRVGGTPPDAGWLIEIDTAIPTPARVTLQSGGIATSTTRLRTWRDGDSDRHHLIDPKTLAPSAVDAVSCTVIAGTAAWAETFTKVAFSHDPAVAIAKLEAQALAASITTTTGDRLVTSTWREFEP
jgi:thiamine biosynthesis lipoprotein